MAIVLSLANKMTSALYFDVLVKRTSSRCIFSLTYFAFSSSVPSLCYHCFSCHKEQCFHANTYIYQTKLTKVFSSYLLYLNSFRKRRAPHINGLTIIRDYKGVNPKQVKAEIGRPIEYIRSTPTCF